MVALTRTVAYLGLEARAVEVQCHIGPGLPRFNVVGLPDKAVSESRERVQAALAAMGLALPPKRITVNLSPADLPKDGSHYDLPIALALLAAMGVTDAEQLGDWIAVGELALDGRVVASPGVLIAALHASAQGAGLIDDRLRCTVGVAIAERIELHLCPDGALGLVDEGCRLLDVVRLGDREDDRPAAVALVALGVDEFDTGCLG